MTHDELLNRVVYEEGTRYEWRNALRAVVELHSPIHNSYGDECDYCTRVVGKSDKYMSYPCDTIAAIEEQLS